MSGVSRWESRTEMTIHLFTRSIDLEAFGRSLVLVIFLGLWAFHLLGGCAE